MNVTYMKPPKKNTTLVSESKELQRTRRTASYTITVSDPEGLVAVCQALVYRKDEPIPFLERP
jgi:acyl-CoA thioesterase